MAIEIPHRALVWQANGAVLVSDGETMISYEDGAGFLADTGFQLPTRVNGEKTETAVGFNYEHLNGKTHLAIRWPGSVFTHLDGSVWAEAEAVIDGIASLIPVKEAREAAEAEAFFNALSYDEKRRLEYPPMGDFLDAKVKQSSSDPDIVAEGIAQEADYMAACLAVKAKYPAP